VIPLGGKAGIADDGFVDVLALNELPAAGQRSVSHGFERILLCHTTDGIRAVADLCPHALQPLAGSAIVGGSIRCAKHGAVFDLVTGKPQNGVTPQALRVYPVRVRAGRIEVGVKIPPAPIADA
jgi:nitrite reductase/ring-hydroxylating ferredoxin subunit